MGNAGITMALACLAVGFGAAPQGSAFTLAPSALAHGRCHGALEPHRALASAGRRRARASGAVHGLVAQEQRTSTQTLQRNRAMLRDLIFAMDLDQDGQLNEQEMAMALEKVRGRAVTAQELDALGIEWSIGANGAKVITTEDFMLAVERGRVMEFANLSAAQVQSLMITTDTLRFNPTSLLQSIKNLDEYKERSRQYRRTVFTKQDWVEFRSSDRIYKNLSTMFTSGIIRGLWLEVGTVTSIALAVFAVNWLISHGLVGGDLVSESAAAHKGAAISLPTLPFQLSSSALGLLLVFRTNNVFVRWNSARLALLSIQSHCCTLQRQGMAYLIPEEKEEFTRRVLALSQVLKFYFQNDRAGDSELSERLTQLLGKKDAARLLAAKSRPIQAISDISRLVRTTEAKAIDGSTKARFDLNLDKLTEAFFTCEGLNKTPVPLVYTRHTARFLSVWLFGLPLAMIREFNGNFVMVPLCALVAIFFFGIEELGVQIEEPFSILPLEDMFVAVDANARQMFKYEQAFVSDPEIVSSQNPEIGADAAPL